MSIQQEKFKAIADKIRNHLGGEELIAPNDFADKIDVIVEQKYSTGKQAGIEQGKQAQYDEFWDSYLSGLTYYGQAKRAFGSRGWNNKTFKPPIGTTLKPVNAELYFAEANITDLRGILKERNVTLDLSKVQYCAQFAYYSTITNFPVIDMTSVTNRTSMFEGCSKMVTIEKLNFGNKTTANTNMFNDCTALKNIVIEGVIGNTLDMRWSPLSKDSIIGKLITPEEYEALSDSVKNYNVFEFNGNYYYGGVITALSSTATGKTLTLKKTAVENAFETSEGAADGSTSDEWTTLLGAKTNWTISLV